jgi:pyrroline-5-carboxylate reductase
VSNPWPVAGPIWQIGCGNMGGAMLSRWLECGLEADRVTVVDPAPRRIEGVRWVAELPPSEPQPSLLILGIKPQMIVEAAPAIAAHAGPGTVILSMLAGVDLATLKRHFSEAGLIVRCMPNLAARIGRSATGLFAPDASAEQRKAINALIGALGIAEWLDDEHQMHALTAVAGSGPAFLYRYIAATAAAGEALGLPADQSLRLAKAMVEGAGALAAGSPDDPDELARQVTSPNGTTFEGLKALDRDGLLRQLLQETLDATAQRSVELSEAAKPR